MCVIILNVLNCYKQAFSLVPCGHDISPDSRHRSTALTLQHPSIGYKGGNPLTGKDRYIWLVNYKELFYNFLPGLVP